MKTAVAATVQGFTEVVKALPRALTAPARRACRRGRVLRARPRGGQRRRLRHHRRVRQHTPRMLHWTRNNGKVNAGDLLLLDAGVEADSLYTADITRTLPVNGTLLRDPAQGLRGCAATPPTPASPPPSRAPGSATSTRPRCTSSRERLADWGLLPVSVEEALSPEGQHHRRWMLHGTSHHLGLDVHDCAQAKRETVPRRRPRPPAWCSPSSRACTSRTTTCHPGGVPRHRRPDRGRRPGHRRRPGQPVSAALPRTADDVEAWMAGIYQEAQGRTA